MIYEFKNGIFLPEYLKKSDDTGYNYALKDVKYFIQEIRLMEEKMNLSLSEDFFASSSAADYTKKSLLILVQMKTKNNSGNKRQYIRFKRKNKKNE